MADGDFMGTQNFTTTQQIQYATAFKQRLHEKSIISRVTNSEWQGKFKGKGTVLEVPVLPIFTTNKRKKGDKVEYADLQNWKEKFSINREMDCNFKIDDEDNEFSALNLESPFTQERSRQMAEDLDKEFFNDIYAKVHQNNCGNEAGFRSGAYKLGTATQPAYLYKSDELAAATYAANHAVSVNVVDYITQCASALEEMPGGLDTTPFCIVPTVVGQRLQTSELSKSDWMGDNGVSTVRKNVKFLGKIGGMEIIQCNQLPMWTGVTTKKADGSTDDQSAAKEFLILFGDTSAVTFADEINRQEKMRDKDEWADFFRAREVYDWFMRYPERMGYGIVCVPGAAV